MPKPPLPDHVTGMLLQPNPAVIATKRADGQPVSVPTWYLYDDGRVLVNMDEGRRRLDYIRDDPRVSLSVMSVDDWHTHVSLQGRVVELVDDPGLVDIDRIAQHYVGKPYHNRRRSRVSAWIEIGHWHAWRASGPWEQPR